MSLEECPYLIVDLLPSSYSGFSVLGPYPIFKQVWFCKVTEKTVKEKDYYIFCTNNYKNCPKYKKQKESKE
ncbi:MAG: hypothetical protein QW625_01995 [Candidatus Nanoarchaeia archaeon]